MNGTFEIDNIFGSILMFFWYYSNDFLIIYMDFNFLDQWEKKLKPLKILGFGGVSESQGLIFKQKICKFVGCLTFSI